MTLPTGQKLIDSLNWGFKRGALLALGSAMVASFSSTAASESEPHLIEVTEGYVTPLVAWVDDAGTAVTDRSSGASLRNHLNEPEIWVADVGVQLFNDGDNDGYFSGFGVTLDVDVDYEWADVYAIIYLQPAGAAASVLHTTNVFSIFERASSDEYRVEVDLTDNFRTDDYNVLIDIVNANTVRIADTVSSSTHRNLEGLPLESLDFQTNTGSQSSPNAFANESTSPANQVRPFANNDDDYYDTDYTLTYSLSAGYDGYYDYYGYSSSFNSTSGSSFGVSVSSTRYGGAAGWLALLTLGLITAGRKRRSPG